MATATHSPDYKLSLSGGLDCRPALVHLCPSEGAAPTELREALGVSLTGHESVTTGEVGHEPVTTGEVSDALSSGTRVGSGSFSTPARVAVGSATLRSTLLRR